MSCIDLLFKSYYNYEFKCFGNYCHNKIKFLSFTDINRLIYITSQWEVISVYDNKISGYCTECIKLRDKKTEEQLKLTINEIKYSKLSSYFIIYFIKYSYLNVTFLNHILKLFNLIF